MLMLLKIRFLKIQLMHLKILLKILAIFVVSFSAQLPNKFQLMIVCCVL